MSALDFNLPDQLAVRRINVMQGEAKASADRNVELTTVLGSCVAMCLFDPVAKIGGMNHFLLAEPPKHRGNVEFDEHYGLFLMELLVNEMLKLGAIKSRLKAHLYGGANINPALQRIGSANAAFARSFLQSEGIQKHFEDLEGTHGRRVHFRPASGLIRCRTTTDSSEIKEKPVQQPKADIGDVELF